MTPDEIRQLRIAKGYDVKRWAAALGVNPRVARRWEQPETDAQHKAPGPESLAKMKALQAVQD